MILLALLRTKQLRYTISFVSPPLAKGVQALLFNPKDRVSFHLC